MSRRVGSVRHVQNGASRGTTPKAAKYNSGQSSAYSNTPPPKAFTNNAGQTSAYSAKASASRTPYLAASAASAASLAAGQKPRTPINRELLQKRVPGPLGPSDDGASNEDFETTQNGSNPNSDQGPSRGDDFNQGNEDMPGAHSGGGGGFHGAGGGMRGGYGGGVAYGGGGYVAPPMDDDEVDPFDPAAPVHHYRFSQRLQRYVRIDGPEEIEVDGTEKEGADDLYAEDEPVYGFNVDEGFAESVSGPDESSSLGSEAASDEKKSSLLLKVAGALVVAGGALYLFDR